MHRRYSLILALHSLHLTHVCATCSVNMGVPPYTVGKICWSLTHLAPVTSMSDESDSHDDTEHSEDECKAKQCYQL